MQRRVERTHRRPRPPGVNPADAPPDSPVRISTLVLVGSAAHHLSSRATLAQWTGDRPFQPLVYALLVEEVLAGKGDYRQEKLVRHRKSGQSKGKVMRQKEVILKWDMSRIDKQ